MKKALVIGSSGFIGTNLVKWLKEEGWWVRGVDQRWPEFGKSEADIFDILDASKDEVVDGYYDRIYQLAADMGGAGFIFTGDNDADILCNSSTINVNALRQAAQRGCGSIFYSSSVCLYPDDIEGKEEQAHPAAPPSAYGWEKLFSEQLYLAFAKNYGLNVKIARFHNTFGPWCAFTGGREKAPAALCRKTIEALDAVTVWGDGTQVRPFLFIEDLLGGIEALMQSDLSGPVNLGPDDTITIAELAKKIIDISKKNVRIEFRDGPTGGIIRNTNNDLARLKLRWAPRTSLEEGLQITYDWIAKQIL